MSIQNCVWSIFDDQSRTKMEEGILVTGIASLLMGAWLNLTLLFTGLRLDLSYRNLTFFTAASLIRCALSVFSYMFNNSQSNETETSCDFLGFWHSLLSVFEVECLTHVCIERYVVAKYITNGWALQKNHYVLYQCLCVFFAVLYSLPPVLGLGRYGLDFSCRDCVLDMVVSETWDRYVVIVIFLLKSVKSTGFMITMLVWARHREAQYDSSDKLVKQQRFTKSVIVVTAVNLICWTPIVMTRGWVIVSYIINNDMRAQPSAFCVQWAMWIQWVSPALTTIAIFLVDQTLRQKMINIFKIKEDIQHISKND